MISGSSARNAGNPFLYPEIEARGALAGRSLTHMRRPFLFQEPKKDRTSSQLKAVYNPRAFFLHAASLHQAFAHCGMFLTAATRRCADRLAVPPLGVALSRPLPVIALVGRYPAN